ncbi:MAG: thymidine kinase [Spirochaetales bacterium]|nr:thymidine kinase [Spirochaetales bacterium]MBP5757451.1 thymidine kinase [Spirochaetales bacterium]
MGSVNTSEDFLKSLGFPTLEVHQTFTHFDFTRPGRRVLLIGPMGSGKTEFAAKVWRDAAIAMKKSDKVKALTSTGEVDRRQVFFIRSFIDGIRFTEYPEDALAYRSGYVRCGENIARIRDSFDLEKVIADNPTVGTYIIDEASFFDERLAYVVRNQSLERGVMFIFPTLILNFRRDIFNSSARLMLDMATDVIPLTAYCEHEDCIRDAFYTYRYYTVDGVECPALYFDPLIVVGGDTSKTGSDSPNYASRCDEHHFLPGKEYTFFSLKPMAEEASKGNPKKLRTEIENLKYTIKRSQLYKNIATRYKDDPNEEVYMNSLKPEYIAEKALMFLFNEQNLVSEDLLIRIVNDLELDRAYMARVLADNRRPVELDQGLLF